MKNKIIFTLLLMLLLPVHILALEDNISISCDKVILKNNMETECQIKANNLTFVTTSISGKIEVSDNLSIISSSYDQNKWKILDSNFSVTDINLISENKNTESNFIIATFKLKANNQNDSTGEIKFTNVELGDEEYESRDINVDDFSLELKYDKENEDIKNNPTTGDLNIIIPTIGITLLLGYCIFAMTKRTNNE